MDRQRRLSIRRESKAGMVFLYPVVGRSDGRAGVHVQAGSLDRSAVAARWQKTDGGYRMEFCVSADALAPARLAAGGMLGFNFIVRGGPNEEIEQFADTRRIQTTWGTPVFWGRLRFDER